MTNSVKMSYCSSPGAFPLCGLTIGELLDEAAEKYSKRTGVIFCDGNIRRTFKEIKDEADTFAAGLFSLSLKREDKIAILGTNTYFYYLTQIAVWSAGFVLVYVNPAVPSAELLYSLQNADAKCLVIAENYDHFSFYETAVAAVPEIEEFEPGQTKSKTAPELTTVISMGSKKLKGAYTFDEVMQRGKSDEGKATLADSKNQIDIDDVCNIMFTSGTTGKPKGAMLSHHNNTNNAISVGRGFSITEKDILCLPVPMSHIFGNVLGALLALVNGSTCVFPAKSYTAILTLDAIAKEKCTVVYGTPTHHMGLLDVPGLKEYDLTSIRMVVTAGSICPMDLIQRIVKNFNNPIIGNMYGMTESGVMYLNVKVDSTVGYPIGHKEMKIIGSHGRILPLEETGEMCIRTSSTLRGYAGDPVKTAELLDSKNWLHTGDLMVMHEDGRASVVGRIKDVIIVGGENVFPKDIEDILYSHPNILEAYAFGVPDPRLGEVVAVWVRLAENDKISESEVKEFCTGKMSFYKIPSYVIFVKEFPKNTNGKVQLHKLKESVITKRHIEKVLGGGI